MPLIVLLLSEEIQYVCGSDLVIDETSEYFGKVKTNPSMTCNRVVETTYFKSKRFPPVCVTCASVADLNGLDPLLRNTRQEVLLPQCQLCCSDFHVKPVVCSNLRKNSKIKSFGQLEARNGCRVQHAIDGDLPELVVDDSTFTEQESEAEEKMESQPDEDSEVEF